MISAALLLIAGCSNVKEPAGYVALSFDDGPNLTTTPQMLDVLESNTVPASFFVNGMRIDDKTAPVMKRAVALGCEIENHSFSHGRMADEQTEEQWIEEIRSTDELVAKYVGRTPQFFRPPYINHNEAMHQVIDHTFICGTGCQDWDSSVDAETRLEVLLRDVKDGDVILLHDFEGNDATVETLKQFIPAMKEKGYAFVTVSELFKIKGVAPEPNNGKVYSNVAD